MLLIIEILQMGGMQASNYKCLFSPPCAINILLCSIFLRNLFGADFSSCRLDFAQASA